MCSHLLGHNTHVNADPKDIWQPIELRWIKNLSCNKWQMIWKPPPFSNTLERLLEFAKSHQRRQHEPPDSWLHSQLGGKKKEKKKRKNPCSVIFLPRKTWSPFGDGKIPGFGIHPLTGRRRPTAMEGDGKRRMELGSSSSSSGVTRDGKIPH